MRRLIKPLFALSLAFLFVFTLAACDEEVQEIEIRTEDDDIQWRYEGDDEWNDLIALEELEGPAGEDGEDGEDGIGIDNVSINEDDELVVTYEDESDENLGVIVGKDGEDGDDGIGVEDVEIDENGELIIELTDGTEENVGVVVGEDGREVELRVEDDYIQWKYDDEDTWTDLVALDDLEGPAGEDGIGIEDLEINDEGELVIELTDGTEENLGNVVGEDAELEAILEKIDAARADILEQAVYSTPQVELLLDEEATGIGSAVVFDQHDEVDAYYVLTNEHVAMDEELPHQLYFPEQDITIEPDRTSLIGIEATQDLALFSIETSEDIQSIPLGDYEDLSIGQSVFAIGHPGGYHNTVTGGYLSASDRTDDLIEGFDAAAIQHDAAVNPGNSGGPLINQSGEIIGINFAGLTYFDIYDEPQESEEWPNPAEGMHFAVQIDEIYDFLDEYKVDAQSTYQFSYNIEDVDFYENFPQDIPVELLYDDLGAYGYENVRVNVDADEGVELMALDSEGDLYDVAETGHWGPEDGFFLKAAYMQETMFSATFEEYGDYTIELELEDLDNEEIITEDTIEIEVSESEEDVLNTTQETFHATIQDALDSAEMDDEIVVNEGVYEENLTFETPSVTLTAVGEPGDVMVQGTSSVEADWITIEGFMFSGDGSGRAVNPTSDSEWLTLRYNIFNDYSTGVYVDAHQSITIDENLFTENTAGIGGLEGDDAWITNNTFMNNEQGIGIHSNAEGTEMHIEDNYFTDNELHLKSWLDDTDTIDPDEVVYMNEFSEDVLIDDTIEGPKWVIYDEALIDWDLTTDGKHFGDGNDPFDYSAGVELTGDFPYAPMNQHIADMTVTWYNAEGELLMTGDLNADMVADSTNDSISMPYGGTVTDYEDDGYWTVLYEDDAYKDAHPTEVKFSVTYINGVEATATNERELSVEEARGVEEGANVSVEGVVTSFPVFEDNEGFFIQDDDGTGIFIWEDLDVAIGNKVVVEGEMAHRTQYQDGNTVYQIDNATLEDNDEESHEVFVFDDVDIDDIAGDFQNNQSQRYYLEDVTVDYVSEDHNYVMLETEEDYGLRYDIRNYGPEIGETHFEEGDTIDWIEFTVSHISFENIVMEYVEGKDFVELPEEVDVD